MVSPRKFLPRSDKMTLGGPNMVNTLSTSARAAVSAVMSCVATNTGYLVNVSIAENTYLFPLTVVGKFPWKSMLILFQGRSPLSID